VKDLRLSFEAPSPPQGMVDLRTLTPARVALARTGSSLTTSDTLALAQAHAEARDAVHATLSIPTLLESLQALNLKPIQVKSAAPDRVTYLRRPDLGRRLSESAVEILGAPGTTVPSSHLGLLPRLTIIVADGLSALAVDRHAIPLLEALLPLLAGHFTLTPVIVAEQARVAIGDQIGSLLKAGLAIVLIGERPGLSSPDSLGAYLTWSPRPGRTDAERNCISNIRTEGLDYQTAAQRIAYLCREAERLQLSGTAIKEASNLNLS
jgi:ethanolamine ammonia-lyase small subunit